MNKLYKYLPVDVDFASGFTTYKLTYGLMERIESGEIEGLPILRPFEDLTKELPLTKAAAEMIGMEEGEIPTIERDNVSIIILFWCILLKKDYINFKNLIYENNTITYYTNDIDFLLNIDYTLYLNHYNGNDSMQTLSIEEAFDFLRAMKFAIDFKEDEYIKLED